MTSTHRLPRICLTFALQVHSSQSQPSRWF
jgi:hypothetical protein